MSKLNYNKKVVLAGGPSTGKTSIINRLKKNGYQCFDEAAREILSNFNEKGGRFKSNPIEISNEILIKRDFDFKSSKNIKCKDNLVFFDRGVHEITAYLRSIDKSDEFWENIIQNYNYDIIFIFPPWEKIYTKDLNRIEDFEEAKKISPFIFEIYSNNFEKFIEVPKLSLEERVKFILERV